MDLKSIYTNVKKKEDQIEFSILKYLEYSGGMFWKSDFGGRRIKGRMVKKNQFVLSGMPDISGVLRGTGCYFEVKTEAEYKKIIKGWDKYLNYSGKGEHQLRYQRQIKRILQLRDNGAIAEFVCNVDQVKEALTRVK